jgi:hypothetical protein
LKSVLYPFYNCPAIFGSTVKFIVLELAAECVAVIPLELAKALKSHPGRHECLTLRL